LRVVDHAGHLSVPKTPPALFCTSRRGSRPRGQPLLESADDALTRTRLVALLLIRLDLVTTLLIALRILVVALLLIAIRVVARTLTLLTILLAVGALVALLSGTARIVLLTLLARLIGLVLPRIHLVLTLLLLLVAVLIVLLIHSDSPVSTGRNAGPETHRMRRTHAADFDDLRRLIRISF
jgi:hypothetical protein